MNMKKSELKKELDKALANFKEQVASNKHQSLIIEQVADSFKAELSKVKAANLFFKIAINTRYGAYDSAISDIAKLTEELSAAHAKVGFMVMNFEPRK
jgi:5-formyltetrahydrofolate cyclo-ligase